MSALLEKKASATNMGGLDRKYSEKSMKVSGAVGEHSFSEEEKEAFSEHINLCLRSDPALQHLLPLNTSSMDLFEKANDGLLLCRLINEAQRDAIDDRALNMHKTEKAMSVYQKTENQNLALNAAKAIGCQVINIGAQDIIEGKPILILGLVWQIIKIQLLSQISLRNVPELVLLLQEEETLADFLKLHPELILLRWLNYHLEKAGSQRRVKNFGADLADSEVYSIVLNRLDPEVCNLIPSTEPGLLKAGKAINNAKAIGAEVFLKPKDICDGNKKLNTSMVAQLFNTNHGLRFESDRPKSIRIDLSMLDIDDSGDSREARVFRMWINSLNIEGVYLNDIFSEAVDGLYLIKVIDRVQPNLVIWKRVNLEPKSRFKYVENGNYVVELGKFMKFSLINVGGLDIVDGNKKLILALLWQLMRRYTLQVLTELAAKQGLAEVGDDQVVAWANEKVKSSGKSGVMKSFKDSSLKNGIFLLELCSAIEPRAVQWDVVKRSDEYDDNILNAKYAISIARKIGACVFLTPEDVVEVKSKMIMTYVSAMWLAYLTRDNIPPTPTKAAHPQKWL